MPDSDGLTLLGRRMLNALRARGDWMTRKELAAALHYDVLGVYHGYVLKRMAKQGLIEFRRRQIGKRGPSSYEYRVKP